MLANKAEIASEKNKTMCQGASNNKQCARHNHSFPEYSNLGIFCGRWGVGVGG